MGISQQRVEELLLREEGRLVAPAVFVSEVLGRISSRTKAGGTLKLDMSAAQRAADRVWDLDVSIFPPDPRQDTPQLLKFGKNLSITDAAYVLLAERLDGALYTFDRRLIDGTRQLGLGELAREP